MINFLIISFISFYLLPFMNKYTLNWVFRSKLNVYDEVSQNENKMKHYQKGYKRI